MAWYWAWEHVSPVRRLRDEYDELLDVFDFEIERMEGNLNNIRSQINSMHKTLKSYDDAKGIMAELYYNKIDESEAAYKTILSTCENTISTIRGKRSSAQQIRNNLQYYYQREQNEDIEYSLGEIGL